MRFRRAMLCVALGWIAAAAATERAGTSALALAAASLKPGAWVELKTEGFTKELTKTSKSYSIFGWSDDGAWDPQSGQFLFMGFRQEYKFIALSEATGAWRTYPAPEVKQTFGHPYGNNAIDPENGLYYHLECGTPQVRAFDTRKETWTLLPPCPFPCVGLALSIEYFPEAKALIFLHHQKAYAYEPAAGKWREFAKGIPVGTDHVLFHYNTKHRCLLLLGGNGHKNKVAVIDAQGQITAKKDAPVEMSMGAAYNAAIEDPVSGDVLVLSIKDDCYAYDLAGDIWRRVGKTAEVTPLRTSCVVGAPIAKYGVSIWVEGYADSARHVWLYKHARP